MTTSTLDRGAGPCDRAGQPLVSSCGLSNRLVQGWPGCHASLKRREKFLRILLPKKQWNSSLDQEPCQTSEITKGEARGPQGC